MTLERLPNETDFEYHKRLVYGKLVDKTLADYDYSEIAESLYGKAYAPDVARRMLYGSRNTIDVVGDMLKDSASYDCLSEIDSRMIDLQKERQKFFDQRTAFNNALRERSREEELNEILDTTIRSGGLPGLAYEPTERVSSDNDIIVSLHDLHYGAVVDNAWNKYNPDICAEMLCQYIDKIVAIGERHHSENCYIMCCGDAISGAIHYSIAVTNKEDVVKQITHVSELIAEFVAELSKHFCTVHFISVSGNHSRINPDKKQCQRSERLDNIVEWYMKARLQNFENVFVDDYSRLDETMAVLDIRGKSYCLTHGDYDTSDSKIQALQTLARKPLYAVFCGHKHHNYVDTIQGIKLFMAGSFQGIDSFCVDKRIYGRPEQMVCVCDNTGVVCQYDIPLGEIR